MKQLKTILFALFTLLMAGVVVSCKSTYAPLPPVTTESNTTKTVTHTVHDTIFKIEKDSSYYKAYLECVNGKVVIKNSSSTPGASTLQPPKVNIKDNIITVDCETKAKELFAKWKSTYVNQENQTIIKVPYPVERSPTWWEKVFTTLGKIFLGIIILAVILLVLRLLKYI